MPSDSAATWEPPEGDCMDARRCSKFDGKVCCNVKDSAALGLDGREAYDPKHKPMRAYSECGHVEPDDDAPDEEYEAWEEAHFMAYLDYEIYDGFMTCEDGFSGVVCAVCGDESGEFVPWPCGFGDPSLPIPERVS